MSGSKDLGKIVEDFDKEPNACAAGMFSGVRTTKGFSPIAMASPFSCKATQFVPQHAPLLQDRLPAEITSTTAPAGIASLFESVLDRGIRQELERVRRSGWDLGSPSRVSSQRCDAVASFARAKSACNTSSLDAFSWNEG